MMESLMKTLRAFGMVATVAILLGRAEILLAANTEQSPGTGPKLVSESSESLMTVGDKCFRLWVTDDTGAGTPSWDSALEPPPLDLVQGYKFCRTLRAVAQNDT